MSNILTQREEVQAMRISFDLDEVLVVNPATYKIKPVPGWLHKISSFIVALSMTVSLLAGCGSAPENVDAGKEAVTEAEAETGTEAGADAEAGTVAEAGTGTEAGTVAEAQSETESGAAAAATENSGTEWDLPNTGFKLKITDRIKNLKGQIYPNDTGEVNIGMGIFLCEFMYIARTNEEIKAAEALYDSYNDENDPDGSKRKAVSTDLYGKAVVDLFFVMACDEDKSFEDALATLQVDSSKLGKAGELGQSGEYKYYYFSGDYSEYENELREALTDEFYPEYKALLADVENIAAGITLTEPKKLKSGTTLGNKISFETKDLDGNTVTSEELFAQNKVTMINIWATWCGPCKNELSELEKMNTEIEAKGCKIIGICDDAAEGASTIKEAKSILEEKGVHYLNLQQTAEIKSLLPPLAYPTTYFVDSEGRLLTEPVVGALFSEYHARLDEALEIVEGAE